MQSNNPAILVEHEHERAIVSFVAPVSESSIIELIRTINDLQKQRFYRQVELQIASPGGQVLALQYFLEALAHWKNRGLNLTTLALTSCSSAAAVMLSLGNRRKASPTSLILYHFARIHVSENTPITRTHASHFAESLQLLDTRILSALVARAASNPPQLHHLTAEDCNALHELRIALGDPCNESDDSAWLQNWLKVTMDGSEQEQETRWTTLYRHLCETDRPISGRLAYRLGLVDELVQPMAAASESPPPPHRSLRIPQWRAAYTNGAVNVDYLKRHTLVLGETGSGKTASAILPVLAAAYHSPEVGVALVIDPKQELGRALVMLEKSSTSGAPHAKKIEFILTEEIKIDLMSTEAWNIDSLLSAQKYWSAAERMLQRVAGLSASSAARILLGHPPTSSDPYWEREGVRFATAVIAVAVAWVVDGNGFARLIRSELSDGGDKLANPWDSIRKCFQRIYPDAFAWEPKWEEQLKRVRDEYTRLYAERRGEDLEQSHMASVEPGSRYKTRVPEFIDGTLARSCYERKELNGLSDMATSNTEKELFDAMEREYDGRLHEQREEYGAVWEKELDALPVEKVWPEIIELVSERLPQGVAGRSESEWRSLLSVAVDESVEELQEQAKRLEERARQDHLADGRVDVEDVIAYQSDANAYEQGMAQAIDTVFEHLIAERLRDAEGDEWTSLLKDARTKKMEQRPSSIAKPSRSTVFLDVLDKFELRSLRVGSTEDETANVMTVGSRILQELFSAGDVEQKGKDQDGEEWKIPTAAECLALALNEHGGELAKVGGTIGEFARMRTHAPSQYVGVMGYGASIMEEFARPGVGRVVYFGCERAVRGKREGLRGESANDSEGDATRGGFLDFRESVSSREGAGTVYVYQPSRHKHDELIAKACKSLFFEAVLDSEERKVPDPSMPLAGYIADEFQRFVTADLVHGEQSFLDVCRSFGAFAVLACQSIASLRYALCDLEGDPDKRNSAIDIIYNNTATKLFFRSTDQETVGRVRTVSPIMWDGNSVIDFRPLSTLKAGECYASFPDGRFERVQIEEYGEGE